MRFPEKPPIHAGAVRVHATNATQSSFQLVIFLEDGGSYRAAPRVDKCTLIYTPPGGVGRDLATKAVPAFTVNGPPVECLLGRAGGRVWVSLNGQLLLDAPDQSSAPGTFAIDAVGESDTSAEKIEYLNLDGLPEAEALKLAGVASSAEPWQDVLRDPARLTLLSGAQLTPEGLRLSNLDTAIVRPGDSPLSDGAVRARTIFGAAPAKVLARANKDGHYQLAATPGKSVMLSRWEHVGQGVLLAEFPTAKPLQAGEEYELELRVVGPALTAKLNGVLLGTATDATFAKGGFGVSVTAKDPNPTLVKSLEVLDLDAPAGVPPNTSSAAVLQSWRPLFTATEWGQENSGRQEIIDGILHLLKVGLAKPQPSADGAIRVRIRIKDNTSFPSVHMRAVDSAKRYKLYLNAPNQVYLDVVGEGGKSTTHLAEYVLPQPLQPGDTLLLELHAQGDQLTGLVNGQAVIDVHDSTYAAAGQWGINAGDGWYESVEVRPLDAPP